MWKREKPLRKRMETVVAIDRLAASSSESQSSPKFSPEDRPSGQVSPVNIGKTAVLHGELTANEDLTIEGRVEGKIELRQHVLTIGVHGKVKSEILAKSVIIIGEVDGNIVATDKVDIRNAGSVDGDIVSPRVAIAEGAHFRGSIDMQREPSIESKPALDSASVKPKVKRVAAAPVRELPLSGQPHRRASKGWSG